MEQVHTIRKYEYYDRDTLCSIIDVDFTTKQVRVENKDDSVSLCFFALASSISIFS